MARLPAQARAPGRAENSIAGIFSNPTAGYRVLRSAAWMT